MPRSVHPIDRGPVLEQWHHDCAGEDVKPPRARWGTAFELRQTQVALGSEEAAKKYYSDVVSPQLKFLSADKILNSTIKDLFTYFGYDGIAASDLHRLSSADVMAKGKPGEILATRFFAPKITAVADHPVALPEGGFGWRSMTQLKSRAGSLASINGINSVLFLQNIFQPKAAQDPFDTTQGVSKFNQVIIVRAGSGPFSAASRAVYFLAYGPLVALDAQGRPTRDPAGKFVDDGKLAYSLKATFDSRDPESNLTAKEYFVPDSCLQCHGGIQARGKANFLDTDYWFDRVVPAYGVDEEIYKQEDFVALAATPFGVLYDAGKDTGTPRYAQAFDVIRQLNNDIRTQNANAGGDNDANFQLRAVQKWLQIHKTSNDHVSPYLRGFGNQAWQQDNGNHRKLVYFLNRYCYRCHSSVRYDIYNRQSVKGLVSTIKGRVLTVDDPTTWMPQDRIVPGLKVDPATGQGQATAELKIFLDLLSSLEQEP